LRGLPHPHNEKGEPIREKLLQGAPLPFKPTVPMPWADKAPNIAGLPGWEDKNAVKFLMTGLAYNDLPGRPPMAAISFQRRGCDGRGGVSALSGAGGKGQEVKLAPNDEALSRSSCVQFDRESDQPRRMCASHSFFDRL